MKKHFMTVLLLLNSIIIFAQKDLPAFGKIDKADLLLHDVNLIKMLMHTSLLTMEKYSYVREKPI